MSQERVRWIPAPEIASFYDEESLSFHDKTLSMIFYNDEKKKISVTFNQSVIAYAATDEMFRMAATDDLWVQNKELQYTTGWTFYKVINSSYIKALSTQLPAWTHYAFHTQNTVIDVIADQDPIIEHLKDLHV